MCIRDRPVTPTPFASTMFVPAVSVRVTAAQTSVATVPNDVRVRVATVHTASNDPEANFAAVKAPSVIPAAVIQLAGMEGRFVRLVAVVVVVVVSTSTTPCTLFVD